jgi:hypothetical protein
MPAPAKIDTLPAEDRNWLEKKLIEQGFGGYDALAEMLAERGIQISKSSIHRFGQDFKQRLEAIKRRTEMACALRDHLGDDSGAMTDALNRMMQDKLFTVLEGIDAQLAEPKDLASLTRAIADLARASISQKKWQDEVRQKVEAVATEVTKIATSEGVGAESITFIRRKILGIPNKGNE